MTGWEFRWEGIFSAGLISGSDPHGHSLAGNDLRKTDTRAIGVGAIWLTGMPPAAVRNSRFLHQQAVYHEGGV